MGKGLRDVTTKIYGMMTNIDENFGRLLAHLEALRLRENTIVIYMSDDGPGHEYNAGMRTGEVYDGRIRCPLFVQWPERLQGGRSTDRIACHIDILPTVMELCGLALPSEPVIDGVSLAPLLTGETTSWPDRALFLQCHRGLTPRRYQNCAIVTQEFKIVGYPETLSEENLEISMENPTLELYNLLSDPGEQQNIFFNLVKSLGGQIGDDVSGQD